MEIRYIFDQLFIFLSRQHRTACRRYHTQISSIPFTWSVDFSNPISNNTTDFETREPEEENKSTEWKQWIPNVGTLLYSAASSPSRPLFRKLKYVKVLSTLSLVFPAIGKLFQNRYKARKNTYFNWNFIVCCCWQWFMSFPAGRKNCTGFCFLFLSSFHMKWFDEKFW